jgi:beta-glucosidase
MLARPSALSLTTNSSISPSRSFLFLVTSLFLAVLATSCGDSCSVVSTTPASSTLVPTTPAMSPDERADTLIASMSLEEKIQLVHGVNADTTPPRPTNAWVKGVPRLNIPDLFLSDGSVGVVRGVGPAIALPAAIASAASWDLDLAYKYGEVSGKELSAYGMNVNLGGNINLTGREPRDGRTFETRGEDPILAGRITAQYLKATQDQHVLATIKHFALNDQETGRGTANAIIDDRSARESDLLAFEIALHYSNAQVVMCSYNLINGIHACENPNLLQAVLKTNWAFPGFVLSDFSATASTVNAALTGLDQEQPYDTRYGSDLQAAVQSCKVPVSQLDSMVHRILRAMFEGGLFDFPQSVHPIDAPGDAAIAQEIEEQGAVLLKNANVLPIDISAAGSIAVIGSHADIGVLSGGGSSQVEPVGGFALVEGHPCPPCVTAVIWDPSSPLQAIRSLATSADVQYADGTDPPTAVALAAKSKFAIVFVSQWTSENMDIPSLNFTDVIHAVPVDQDALVSAVAAVNPNTIVVMENGGPQIMPWLGKVGAVLEAWFPGQRGGEAIANILFGNVNPSGKLPITFPASTTQLPRPVIAAPPDQVTPFPVDYTIDGYNEGYKWYESKGLTPLFPFGFGLSYTTFAVENPTLSRSGSSSDLSFSLGFEIGNSGKRAGSEIEQVYVQLPPSTKEMKRLIAWQKTSLSPAQSESVAIQFSSADPSHPFSYWDANSSSWLIAPGTYTIFLGNSSDSLTTVGTFDVQ